MSETLETLIQCRYLERVQKPSRLQGILDELNVVTFAVVLMLNLSFVLKEAHTGRTINNSGAFCLWRETPKIFKVNRKSPDHSFY